MEPILRGVPKAEFDLVVIGSGPGGQRAAVQAAKSGKKVALIEKHHLMGGACVHVGTLPSKSLRESVYRWSMGSKGFLGKMDQGGFVCDLSPPELPDMARLMRRKERVIENESELIESQLLRNQIQTYVGMGQFVGEHELEVLHSDGSRSEVNADFVVIAVGASPVAPVFCTMDGERILDSTSVLQLKKTPKSMVVLGAGIIGCEYASIFQAAGTKVTLIDKRTEMLANVDHEIVFHLVERLTAYGMEIVLGAELQKVESRDGFAQVDLGDGRSFKADVCLVALGRKGNTDSLQLDRVGLRSDERGLIAVKSNFRTEVPWIYAVGDVIGFPALASTSMEQGRIAVCDAFGMSEDLSGFEVYPYGIYCIPEISTVGATEEALREQGIPFVAGRARYHEIARGHIVGDEWGMLKLLVHAKTYKILGVHIIGENAADLIHIGQAVIQLNGDLTYFIRSVFNYPTFAEAYKTAAFNAYNILKGRPSDPNQPGGQ